MATHLNLAGSYESDPEEAGLYWASRYTDTKKIFGLMPDNIFANADVTSMGEPINLAALCRNYSCPKTTKPENIIGKSMQPKLRCIPKQKHFVTILT